MYFPQIKTRTVYVYVYSNLIKCIVYTSYSAAAKMKKMLKKANRAVADELEGEVEVEELGELGGQVHREALEPVVARQLLLRLHQHRVRRVLNIKVCL